MKAEYTYLSLLEDGKVWEIGRYDGYCSEGIINQFYSIEVVGDTIINDTKGKLVISEHKDQKYSKSIIGIENNRVICSAYIPELNFMKLMDFNLHPGDSAGIYIITAEDVIEFKGIPRRVLTL